MNNFANNFKDLRIKNGFTIKQVAKIIGVCPTTIASWEQGKTSPRSNVLIKIVKLFKVTCNHILGL